ncbi:hypothetical protein [Celeribacter persicus]|uniref:TspO/MBR related protein n=1 Tax=Celeribacter persicus TaxID=1651082 RepID=A0A2T5HSL2_9RHOB|nr:hypothetical protein [Celeribacter persicus]PTQ74564.1 hypothetical protein C8N42_104209 [Celeribacter persicus]
MIAVFHFAAALAFAIAGPLLAPDFRGYDPNAFPIPQGDAPVGPVGYAFSIWGVIYIWLIVSAGVGLFKRSDAPDWAPMRPPLIAALVIGTPWLSVAVMNPVIATVMIFLMLALAMVAMKRAPILDPWLARAPTALFAGWLTAASFASLGYVGAGYGVVFDAVGWAYLCLIGALAVAIYGTRLRPDAPLYPFGTAWALIAIVVRNWGSAWGVATLAGLGAVLLLGLSARAFSPQNTPA